MPNSPDSALRIDPTDAGAGWTPPPGTQMPSFAGPPSGSRMTVETAPPRTNEAAPTTGAGAYDWAIIRAFDGLGTSLQKLGLFAFVVIGFTVWTFWSSWRADEREERHAQVLSAAVREGHDRIEKQDTLNRMAMEKAWSAILENSRAVTSNNAAMAETSNEIRRLIDRFDRAGFTTPAPKGPMP